MFGPDNDNAMLVVSADDNPVLIGVRLYMLQDELYYRYRLT
jgi:hypothetical protein